MSREGNISSMLKTIEADKNLIGCSALWCDHKNKKKIMRKVGSTFYEGKVGQEDAIFRKMITIK